MIQSDEPSPEDWKFSKGDETKKVDDLHLKTCPIVSGNSRFSSFDGTNDPENVVDEELDINLEDDVISNSIKSKTSAKPEQESCVISVNSTEILENDLGKRLWLVRG